MKIKDIAELVGTSVATVSRVINNDRRVSEEMRQKVLLAIEETGYRPNGVGRDLRRKCSRRLLMMLPTIRNSFYSDLVVGFEEQARILGYGVLLAVTHRHPEIERQYYDLAATKQVDGVASFIPTIGSEEINRLAERFPFVACCWRAGTDINASYVCIDNEKAAFDTMQYLFKLGHRRIAVLNGNFPERTYERERDRGYRRALSEAEIPYRSEYYIPCDYDWQSSYKACKRLMSLKEPPTAIFAMSDERAVGVVKYLSEHGYRAGADVDVVGFDNVTLSQITTPEITTVSQPCHEIGREAVNLLVSRINDPGASNKGIILAHKLIVRGSTRELTE